MTKRSSLLWAVLPVGLAVLFVVVFVVAPGRRPAPHSRPGPPGRHTGGRAPAATGPLGIPGHWKPILDAEFDRGTLDRRIWRPDWFGHGISGPINRHESACYSPQNVRIAKGSGLSLIVSRTPSRCGGSLRPFTGAVLSTNPLDGRSSGGFTYRYGVLEARIDVPAIRVHGVTRIADWPAVVGLGQVWPRDGEDDVFENLGGLVCAHFISPGHAPGSNLGGCDPGFTPGWHVVESDWEPGRVTWYYDGIEFAHTDRGVTSAPMYIVLVNTTSMKSPEVARADALRVAYVRVWQRVRPAGRTR